ncbi:MAG: protease inhibitor I42 family protein [Acidobacteria bacterium]|nr:protease inhibitor I42 family protein [Acidobacteriota bacterium]
MKNSRIAAACAATTILALGAIVAGCGSSSSSSASTAVPTDVPKDAAFAEVYSTNGDGESGVGGVVGGTFVVKLDCSPGTGYQWKVKTSGDAVLALKDTSGCETPENTTSAVGVPGIETRTYEVKTAGTEKLVFTWVPPGKQTPEATQTITFTAS